jgi:hypothetical protein
VTATAVTELRPYQVTDDGNAWDVVIEADDDSAPRLEPNAYLARVVHGTTKMLFKTRRLVLTFEILQSKYTGARLDFICELRTTKHSKFMRTWEIANGGPAKRRDRLSLNVFRNRLFRVSVRDVIKDRHQRTLARPYSIIDSILEREA